MRPQLKVRHENAALFVDQLCADARPSIELVFKIGAVHLMDAGHVVDEDVDGMLGEVTRDVLPDQAPLLRKCNKPIAVQYLAKVGEVELLEPLIRLEGESRRCRRPNLHEAFWGHRAVDAQRVRSLQRYRVHYGAVLLFQRLLAHAVEALHREYVQIVANSVCLRNL